MRILSLLADTLDAQRFVERLEFDGYQIVQATDADVAYSLLKDDQFQAAILDYDVADRSLINSIRQLDLDEYIYIFGLISNRETEHIDDLVDDQADEYIIKPVEPDELIARLVVVDRYINILSDIRARHRYIEPIRDDVTGTFSRTTILELLETEINRSHRTLKPFALGLLELDDSNRLQSEFEPDFYNRIMIQVALKIWASVRAYDLIGRWEDNRFLILLPETAISGASVVAERIRKNIGNVPLRTPDGGQLPIGASLGFVLCGQQEFISMQDLLQSATGALEKATDAGGNQVVYI